MLLRLKVSGFKNLVNVDVRFGPFTCIAGPNAVGKSNLFDAIQFLSLLANDTLMNAALAVRSKGGRTGDIRSLFHRVGDRYADAMSFEAEMLIPPQATDDLGQTAQASTTLVRYRLEIGYRHDEALPTLGSLVLRREELGYIKVGDAPTVLGFPHSPEWRKSVVIGARRSPFISTKTEQGKTYVQLSQDGVQGRPKSFLADNLPRTMLSTVNALESPTALTVRREMQSWQLLQLEPSALREPDTFTTPPGMLPDGSRLPATLYHLARTQDGQRSHNGQEAPVYEQVARRLAELVSDVVAVEVEPDPKRELLTVQVTARDGTVYPARALSDGTLRFLALATIAINPHAGGLICLEEPENGIHPSRIPAMLRLLQDIACDPQHPVGPDNPLRQVIVNTHSPAVVSQVPDDALLVAELQEVAQNGVRFPAARFSWLPDTWRAKAEPEVAPVPKGRLLDYLNPVLPLSPGERPKERPRRVADRPDLQQLLLFPGQQGE